MTLAAESPSFAFPALPLIMGIVNVTPDSFSDGGRFLDPAAAVDHAFRLEAEGADILDIGAESTRPGAEPIGADKEWRRLEPVLKKLCGRTKVRISIDTYRAETAERAIDLGATIINDVRAGMEGGDPDSGHSPMFALAAQAGAGICLMHMRGHPKTMQQHPEYRDAVEEVADFLAGRVGRAVEAGIARESIWIDPGFGFGKSVEHNCELIRGLPRLGRIAPVLVGLSRKSSLAKITGCVDAERLPESLAGAIAAWRNGASVLRVHDVASTIRAMKVFGAMSGA